MGFSDSPTRFRRIVSQKRNLSLTSQFISHARLALKALEEQEYFLKWMLRPVDAHSLKR